MELRQLRFFVTLAEELHFRRASERMHIAQPAFSEQIRRLERELGTRLFDRTSHYVRITQAGLLFLDEVRPALAQVEHAAVVASQAGQGMLGRITIGFTGSAANELTPLILRRYRERHPAVSVALREYPFSDPSAGLGGRETDVAFVRPPFDGTDDLVLMPLLEEQRVAVMASDNPLAACTRVTVDDLLLHPFILGPRPSGLDGRRPDGPKANTTEEWLSMIAAGTGVSLAPASSARLHPRPGICFVPATGVPPSGVAVARRSDRVSAPVEEFADAARASARDYRQRLRP
jgi:DNA-binding transcriptional LysR family regulator